MRPVGGAGRATTREPPPNVDVSRVGRRDGRGSLRRTHPVARRARTDSCSAHPLIRRQGQASRRGRCARIHCLRRELHLRSVSPRRAGSPGREPDVQQGREPPRRRVTNPTDSYPVFSPRAKTRTLPSSASNISRRPTRFASVLSVHRRDSSGTLAP